MIALVTAPALWLVSWTLMRLGGGKGPGPLWTGAHTIWIVSYALFAVAAVVLARRARWRAGWAVAIAWLGTAALIAQMVVDLVVGLRAADKPAMSALYDSVFATPGVELALYQIGPALLFIGLLALAILARTWPAVFAAAGIALMLAGRPAPGVLRGLEALGMLILWGALAAAGRRPTPARPGLSRPDGGGAPVPVT